MHKICRKMQQICRKHKETCTKYVITDTPTCKICKIYAKYYYYIQIYAKYKICIKYAEYVLILCKNIFCMYALYFKLLMLFKFFLHLTISVLPQWIGKIVESQACTVSLCQAAPDRACKKTGARAAATGISLAIPMTRTRPAGESHRTMALSWHALRVLPRGRVRVPSDVT